jgi:hypothetical protein
VLKLELGTLGSASMPFPASRIPLSPQPLLPSMPGPDDAAELAICLNALEACASSHEDLHLMVMIMRTPVFRRRTMIVGRCLPKPALLRAARPVHLQLTVVLGGPSRYVGGLRERAAATAVLVLELAEARRPTHTAEAAQRSSTLFFQTSMLDRLGMHFRPATWTQVSDAIMCFERR